MAASPCSVLIVDPYPDCAGTLGEVLAAYGHQARIAHTPADALRLAAADPPDVVISEARFDDMDGFTLVEKMLGLVPEPVVFVMVTGRHQLRGRAALAGFDHFLVKPADPGELVGLVERAGCDSPEPVASWR